MPEESHRPHRAFEPTRRGLLKSSLAAGAAAAATRGSALAAGCNETPAYRRWLLDRVSYGVTPALEATLTACGWELFLDGQIAWQQTGVPGVGINDDAARNDTKGWCPSFDMEPYDILTSYDPQADLGKVFTWNSAIPILMGWQTERVLLHTMADFWTNYFNRFGGMDLQQLGYQWYDHQIFYAETNGAGGPNSSGEALGDFTTMLQQSAKGGSMLLYLDQWQSKQGNVIENYARELLELHTLGLPGPLKPTTFSEDDVVGLAEALTGWTVSFVVQQGVTGSFVFNQADHEAGVKTVLGVGYGPDMIRPTEGKQIIDALAMNASTSIHVAQRMVEWFIGEGDTDTIVLNVAAAFSNSGGDIGETVKELFSPTTYGLADAAGLRKIRRPQNLATLFFRTLDPELTSLNPGPSVPPDPSDNTLPKDSINLFGVLNGLSKMGQRPGYRPSPDGYPGANEEWESGLQARLEFVHRLAFNQYVGVNVSNADLETFFDPTTPTGNYASVLSEKVSGWTMTPEELTEIQGAVNLLVNQVTPSDLRRYALALAFAAPSVQYLA